MVVPLRLVPLSRLSHSVRCPLSIPIFGNSVLLSVYPVGSFTALWLELQGARAQLLATAMPPFHCTLPSLSHPKGWVCMHSFTSDLDLFKLCQYLPPGPIKQRCSQRSQCPEPQQGHQRSCRGWEEGHLSGGGFSILNWLGIDVDFGTV